jgi:ADP-ribosylglycohydrolase
MNKLDKVRGCFLGVAVGDALGMPIEGYNRDEILFITENKGITDFIGPIVQWKSDVNQRDLNCCSTTDDWALTKAVAISLIQSQGFDLLDQALAHVAAYETNTCGWGQTTKSSLKETKIYFDSRGRMGKSPFDLPAIIENKGAGNGVAMKVAPLAMMSWLRHEETAYATYLSSLTHSSLEASDAGLLIELMIRYSADYQNQNSKEFDKNNLQKSLKFLYNGEFGQQSLLYAKAVSLLHNFDLIMSKPLDFSIALLGNGFAAYDSIPLALAIYFRNSDNFTSAILEAVNFAKDSDTVGSIVGSLLGAKLGYSNIPLQWRRGELKESLALADFLYGVFYDSN